MTIKLITAFVLAFLFATAFGKFYIPWLKKEKARQEIKENGPSWHKAKSGTPTMGGVMFILAVAFVCLGHSKSCSGVRDLTSAQQWTDSMNRLMKVLFPVRTGPTTPM